MSLMGPVRGRAAVAVMLLSLGGCDGGQNSTTPPDGKTTTPVPVTAVPMNRLTLAPLVERVAPAVVSIAVLQPSPLEQNPLLRDPYFRRYFGVPDDAMQPRLSAGSGVIVDSGRGLVITNSHVVANAQAIEVLLPDGRRFPAKLLGSDQPSDIAVLDIAGQDLPQLELGDSEKAQVGDYVVAIGNPFGLGQTVTAGIVSAVGRGLSTDGYESYIQTDAPINPGNSGGPLIGMGGTVVGINSALFGPGANVGIGFAVPARTARFVMDQVLKQGEVRRGQIGVVITDAIPQGAGGLPTAGALITGVESGSAAAQAGLRRGDIVVAVNDRPTPNASALRNEIGLSEIGERLNLTIRRGEGQQELTVQVRGPE